MYTIVHLQTFENEIGQKIKLNLLTDCLRSSNSKSHSLQYSAPQP